METRAGKYGRNLAVLVSYAARGDKEYLEKFLRELRKYSLQPRKKHEEKVTTYELTNIETINPENPKQLARLIKEGLHLMYQKQTAKRVLKALEENL